MGKTQTALPHFNSKIGALVEDFLTEKRAMGYRYEVETRKLVRFERFLVESGLQRCCLPEDLVRRWIQKKDHECPAMHRMRFRLIRQFAEYLRKRGYEAYVPNGMLEPVARTNFTPYIFTHAEMQSLLSAADHLSPSHHSPHRHVIMPELFRLLYGCGLRIGEALRLTLADTDLKKGILTVRQGKFRKDRLVPMAPQLTARLRRMRDVLGGQPADSAPLFPSPSGAAYGINAVHLVFRELLEKVGIAHGGRGKGPRIHDIRHTFAVHRMQQWFQEGADINAKAAILAAYMGHTTFRNTQLYLHLTVEFAADLAARLDQHYGWSIPRREKQCPTPTSLFR